MTDLITYQELETFMGQSFDATQQAQAGQLITMVSAILETECGVTFSQKTDDVITTQADGYGMIEFQSRPVTNVTSVKDTDSVEVVDWFFDGMGLVYNLWPGQVVTVTYTHGYATVPNDIKAVCLGSCSRVMYNPVGLRQETAGAISVTYPGIGGEAGTINFSALERKIIAKYQNDLASWRMSLASRRTEQLPVLTVSNWVY